MAETHHYLGEGGAAWAFDLPLSEHVQEKVTKGHLRRVNEDGSPWEAPEGAAPEQRPAQSAPKAEWVGYAVRVHGAEPDQAEGMTKADLVEAYGRD